VEHIVGLALETLSHGQELAVSVLYQFYTKVQQSSKPSNNRAAQYCTNLEKLQDYVEEHHTMQGERIAKAL
jgi:hypothetical protein